MKTSEKIDKLLSGIRLNIPVFDVLVFMFIDRNNNLINFKAMFVNEIKRTILLQVLCSISP